MAVERFPECCSEASAQERPGRRDASPTPDLWRHDAADAAKMPVAGINVAAWNLRTRKGRARILANG
jgi:hypothetical protein